MFGDGAASGADEIGRACAGGFITQNAAASATANSLVRMVLLRVPGQIPGRIPGENGHAWPWVPPGSTFPSLRAEAKQSIFGSTRWIASSRAPRDDGALTAQTTTCDSCHFQGQRRRLRSLANIGGGVVAY